MFYLLKLVHVLGYFRYISLLSAPCVCLGREEGGSELLTIVHSVWPTTERVHAGVSSCKALQLKAMERVFVWFELSVWESAHNKVINKHFWSYSLGWEMIPVDPFLISRDQRSWRQRDWEAKKKNAKPSHWDSAGWSYDLCLMVEKVPQEERQRGGEAGQGMRLRELKTE